MATILIVDDVEPVRRVLRWTLEEAGYAVVEAADGRAALRVLEDTPVDLVMLDIIMPEMEGIETIGVLRRTCPHLKVIAISGGGQISAESHLETAQALGAFRALRKPIDHDQLFDAIHAALT